MTKVTDGASCSGTFASKSEAMEQLGRAQALWPTTYWYLTEC